MSSPIDRQVFKDKLKTDVERISPADFELDNFRTAVDNVFAEYGTENFFFDVAKEAELQAVLDEAKSEGLSLDDIKQVLSEVRRHISGQAHFEATREHEQERSAAGWNIFKQMVLKLKDAKTIFGGGVAYDVRTRTAELQADDEAMKALLEGAIALGVMRKRLQRYTELGGADLKGALDAFKTGRADDKPVTAKDLLNTSHEIGQRYDKGLENIIAELHIEAGPGKTITIDGLGEVDVPDEDTKAALEHHLKFVLRTEIIKLVEAEELAVLSSDEYNIAHPKTTAQKAWQVGKGLVASGTMWGIATRIGGRLLLGGALTTVGVTGGGAIIGGMLVGMAAGATAAYVRERVNARERLKRRKLEAALGAINDEVAKPASQINAELKERITALQTAKTSDEQVSAITAIFAAVTNAQVRLRESRHHKQDYISFGIENRFQAQKQLLDNIEKALAALQQAMEQLSHEQQHTVQRALEDIPQEAEQQVWHARTEFTKKVKADEVQRQRRAVLVGSLAGGLGSLAARYVLDFLHVGSAAAETTPTPAAAAPAVEAASIPENAAVVPGSEEMNTLGKSVFIDAHGDHYTLSFDDNHELTVAKFASDGEEIESVTQGDFSYVESDDLQVVHTDTAARIFDEQGHPIADVALNESGGAGNVTEQIFADPDTKQMLDAMGLQPGELQYDPTTKLFHIPDNALHDAAGKPEYLGQTAGWRARRLEFILKAMAEGKTTETPDMIVARAERATASLLLKSPMHGDPAAAFNEAFTKDAGFIQKNIMPWIDGHRSRVSERWMQLVAEMKTQDLSVSADGQGGVVITPLNPYGSPIDFSTTASETAVQAAAAASEPFKDFVISQRTQAGITLLTGLAAGAAWAYEYKGLGDVAHDLSGGGDEYEVPETQLKGVDETVTAIKQEQINKAIAEKGPAIKAEIAAFVSEAYVTVGNNWAKLRALRTTMRNESFAQTHIDALVAEAGSFAAMQAKLTEAKELLAREDSGVKYSYVDAAAGNELTVWIAAQEEVLQVVDVVKEKVKDKIEGTAAVITTIRKDKDKNTTTRRNELKTCLSDLAVVNSLSSIVPAIIPDAAWQTAMETAAQAARTEAEQAIEIAAFIAAADTAVGGKRTALETLRTTMRNESFAQTHIDALVAEAGSFAAMQAKLTEAKELLAREDSGVKYSYVDAAAGNELTVWIAAQEEVLQVVDVVKKRVRDKIEGTVAVITTIRKDGDKNSTTRRDELKTCLTDLAVANSLSSIVPAIIPDTAWQTAMETAAQAATAEAEQAIAVITIDKHISCDAKVAAFVNQELIIRGCFNPADATLPQPNKASFIVKLAKKMGAYREGKTGLEQMGFMTTVGRKSFESKHEARITQVLDRLFNDVDDIFAK